MVKMLMACASGVSSSNFANRLNSIAKEKGIDAFVEGCAISTVSERIGTFDVLLVGPEANHFVNNLNEMVKDSANIVKLEISDFNILNAEKILEKGLAAAK